MSMSTVGAGHGTPQPGARWVISRVMAIDESEQLDRLKDCLGHYVLAVAAAVMRDGVPVTTGGPYTYPDPGEPEEAELTLQIPDDYAARCLGNGGQSMSLDWTSISGWSMYLAFRFDDEAYSQTERWLGAGLVPPPRQVANFLAAAMVDWQTAGSPEQPFYRNRGQDLAPVLARLSPYLPGEEPATKDDMMRDPLSSAHAWCESAGQEPEEVSPCLS
jgi:hypothetical protein